MGSGWCAGAKTLRIATLSLVHSTAEYCAPVWCRSAHTRLIDSVLNDALRIVTECLRPTPTDHLPILSGIQPAELRRLGATVSKSEISQHLDRKGGLFYWPCHTSSEIILSYGIIFFRLKVI